MHAILLDWDGVLVDSVELYLDLYREACRRWGKELPISTAEEFRHWYNPHWEQNYFQMGFTPEELKQVMRFSQTHLDYGKVHFYPGIPAALRSLAGDYPLAIVSTTPATLIRARLEAEGLADLMTRITGGDDDSSEKVEKIRQTMARLGVTTGVMVGDTPLDIEAGRHHGLGTVAVTYGWCAASRVRASNPDRLVETPAGLEAAIRDLMPR
jgi:phosphoglycolate phosphatase